MANSMTARMPPATPEIAAAERRGYASFINGRERDACPYPPGAERDGWLRGYDLSAASPHAVLFTWPAARPS